MVGNEFKVLGIIKNVSKINPLMWPGVNSKKGAGIQMDYGKTLNLLQTDFPMRGNLPQAEPKMQEQWNEMDNT